MNGDGLSDGDYDVFGDVVTSQKGIFGIGDSALQSHDSIKHAVTENGLALEMYCQGCGTSRELMVEYPELIAMKYGVNPVLAFQRHPQVLKNPTNWRYVSQEQAWRPELRCPDCQFHVCIRISHSEPERHLVNARRRNFINPQLEQQASMIASQAAAARGRMR